jgi:hypothetical protein
MAVQQCHILVLHWHWMVVGSRWLHTVMYVVETATFQLSNIVQNHDCMIYAELLHFLSYVQGRQYKSITLT